MKKNIKIYIACVGGTLAAGFISGMITKNDTYIYDALAKPPLAPPNWLFPVIWPILYVLMGVGLAMVLCSGSFARKDALRCYALQLFINLVWPILFFSFELFFLSALWILTLDIAVIIMMKYFYHIKPLSAYLQIPYLVWILFATYLNFGVYFLSAS